MVDKVDTKKCDHSVVKLLPLKGTTHYTKYPTYSSSVMVS